MCGFSSPSTERCERRASRASLALVNELTGAALDVLALGDELTGWRSLALVYMLGNSKESSPMPSMRPTSWGSARNRRDRTGREAVEVVGVVSLGTLPTGTTEAHVDDMMMVLDSR